MRKNMKKYIVTLANMPQNQISCINNHIAVGSLFEVGESITDNTLHSGKNIVDDKRVIDTLVWYKQHHQIGNDCISILEPLNAAVGDCLCGVGKVVHTLPLPPPRSKEMSELITYTNFYNTS